MVFVPWCSIYKSPFAYQFCCFCFEQYTIKGADFKGKYFGYSCLDIEETHCYLLCGTKRALLIDTGLGVANIKEVVDKLTTLPIFVVTTHVHWDHIGGHQYFENIGVHILEKIGYQRSFRYRCSRWKGIWPAGSVSFQKHLIWKSISCFKEMYRGCFLMGRFSIWENERCKLFIRRDIHRDIAVLWSGKRVFVFGRLDLFRVSGYFYPTTDPKQFWQSVKKCSLYIWNISCRDITAFRFRQIWQTGLRGHAEN